MSRVVLSDPNCAPSFPAWDRRDYPRLGVDLALTKELSKSWIPLAVELCDLHFPIGDFFGFHEGHVIGIAKSALSNPLVERIREDVELLPISTTEGDECFLLHPLRLVEKSSSETPMLFRLKNRDLLPIGLWCSEEFEELYTQSGLQGLTFADRVPGF